MNDFKEIASSNIKIATDILFVRNPIGTSMGTVFGIVIHGVVNLFAPALQSIELIKLSALNVFHFIALGVFGFNYRHMQTYHKVKPEIEETLRFIERQLKSGSITKLEAHQFYKELIAKAVENARLDNSDAKQLLSPSRGGDEASS